MDCVWSGGFECWETRARSGFVPYRALFACGRALLAKPFGRGGFALRVRCKDLKTARFPASLRLPARQIRQRTMHAIYEFMT
jgi:hypothetical protein